MTATLALAPVSRSSKALRAGVNALSVGGAIIAVLLIWQASTTIWPSVYFPSPLKILENSWRLFIVGAGGDQFFTSMITFDTMQTLWRLLLGFVIGSFWGIVIGTLIGRSRTVREISDPIVEFLRAIPATATLPLFIILLGGDDTMRVAFIAYGVSWFVLINTANGVGSIHPTTLDLGRAFRLSKVKVFLRIIMPSAANKIFAGLRIALTAALLLAVVSEFMLAGNGIGYQLIQAQQSFNIPNMWSWMLLLAVLGFLMNTVLEYIERLVLAWDIQARTNG